MKKYWLTAAVIVPVVALLVLLAPAYRGESPPPETVGGDIVIAADGFSGAFEGVEVGSSRSTAGASLALAPEQPRGSFTSGTVRTDFPINALGLHWKAEVPEGAAVEAEVRFSRDGEQWGEWFPVLVSDEELPDHINETRSADEMIGQLVFTEEAGYFQYRFSLSQSQQGATPEITGLTASAIDAKGYHESSLSLASLGGRVASAFSTPAAGADPAVISRAQWGANEAWMTWDPEYAAPVKQIVHHTVTSNSDPDPAATVRSIYYYHAVSLGWGDIGYNYLIDQQGRIYEGRYGGNAVIGGHALGWNTGSIGISALGNYQEGGITPAMYSAFVELMSWKSNQNVIDPTGNDLLNGVYYPNYLGHRDTYSTACPGGNLYAYMPAFRAEAKARYAPAPSVYNQYPTGETISNRPLISADFDPVSGAVNPASIVIRLDGVDVTASATKAAGYVSYRPPTALRAGAHQVQVEVSDVNGLRATSSWSFSVAQSNYSPRDYYWPWYDNVNARNWVLMANPTTSASELRFDLSIGGQNMSLASFALSGSGCGGSCVGGQVPPGRVVTSSFGGVSAGPVNVMSLSGARAVVSQRILWGENSLEEVPGIDAEKLSDHYYWPWYDQVTAGVTNWVMISNHNASPVYYEVRIAGQLKDSGTIQPGAMASPTFPGVQAGPVEVQTWTDAGKSVPAKVVASQRVLSHDGTAFNEVPGIPAAEVSDHYYWTWYDTVSADSSNWIMAANHNGSPVYYEIRVGGQLLTSGTLQPQSSITPSFPGIQDGPAEVQAWTGPDKLLPAKLVVSQRVDWGPSFEEVPGYPAGDLSSAYFWTWYDQASPGASNWVMIANFNASPVYYEVRIDGQVTGNGTIPANSRVTPSYPGVQNGPVEVQAWADSGKGTPANIFASQRVIWNGHFNEVVGTVFNLISNAQPSGEISSNRPLITADLAGVTGAIDTGSIVMKLDGVDVTSGATRAADYVSYRPPAALSAGVHSVYLEVADTDGFRQVATWTFTVAATNYTPRDYYWPWYDNVGSSNWVLVANPASASQDLSLDLAVAGEKMELEPFILSGAGCPGSLSCNVGKVPAGRVITSSFPGISNGPVNVMSLSGSAAITSQRILWGANSMEEVPGMDAARLSDHYYWPWYDQLSAGVTDWVMVANHNTIPVYYEIKIAGQLAGSGAIAPGSRVTPTFPGMQNGPVEVQAWTDAGKSAPADVVASQRVLSGYGTAFNELPGIPAEELSDHYYWTWYDQASPGAANWVMMANHNGSPVYYEVKIAGQLVSSGTIAAGGRVAPTFPGTRNGPVEVQAWNDAGKSQGANVVATQRTLWGPSFGEVPGLPANGLGSYYGWTWYDQASAGASNWVMVANHNSVPVYYEARIAGQQVSSGTIAAGGRATPTFAGTRNGPVEVQAWTDSGKGTEVNIIASQRVLWNGHFNELTGEVLREASSIHTPQVPAGPTATVTADAPYEVRDGNGALLATLAAGDVTSVTYAGGVYYVQAGGGLVYSGASHARMTATGNGIMRVTSYNDIPSWNPTLNDNRFRGTIEVRYSPVSGAVWVINELPMEMYLRGIAETSSGSPSEFLKTMTVAARTYALYHVSRGGKYYGSSQDIFHLKNSRNGNGDDQVYKGYGLEARFPDLTTTVTATTGQVTTYNGSLAIATYFSNTDGRTRSAQEAWGSSSFPWLASVPDPDCNGMTMSGHGVGISGLGALRRAERGDSYQTILAYYLTGTAVQGFDTSGNIRVAITSL